MNERLYRHHGCVVMVFYTFGVLLFFSMMRWPARPFSWHQAFAGTVMWLAALLAMLMLVWVAINFVH